MTERQQIAFEFRDLPLAQKLSIGRYTYRQGGVQYATSLWCKRCGATYLWIARVARLASNGRIEPLCRVSKDDRDAMLALACREMLWGVGEGMNVAIEEQGISYSFIRPFNNDELKLAKRKVQ
jgi:hypothetical protein